MTSQLAKKSRHLWGVVGWAPIASAKFPAAFDRLRHKKMKGLQHILQDEPDDNCILRDDFNRSIAAMRASGLVYDILIHERHLPQAIQFVDRYPEQVFVLDHLAKPRIRDAVLDPWSHQREHVYCKVLGLAREADWSASREADLRP